MIFCILLKEGDDSPFTLILLRVTSMNTLRLGLPPQGYLPGSGCCAAALLLSICSLTGTISMDRHEPDLFSLGTAVPMLAAWPTANWAEVAASRAWDRPSGLPSSRIQHAFNRRESRNEPASNMQPNCNEPASNMPRNCHETACNTLPNRTERRGSGGVNIGREPNLRRTKLVESSMRHRVVSAGSTS